MDDLIGPDTYAAIQWGWQWLQSAPGRVLYVASSRIPLPAALVSPKIFALKFGSKAAAGLFPDPPPLGSLPPQYRAVVIAAEAQGVIQTGLTLQELALRAVDAGIDRGKAFLARQAKRLAAGLLDTGEQSGVVVFVVPVWLADP